MADLFEDSEFIDACEELDDPQVEGWDFFTESHGLKIYRQLNVTSGLYQYKVYGTMTEIDAETCSKVYMDLEYRKQWDSYVYELYEKEISGKKFIYWDVKYPKPMSYRDYVYKRELRTRERNGKTVYVILAQALQDKENFPEKWMTIRVVDYFQTVVLTDDPDGGGVQVFMRYYDDPKGNIPAWLVNWASKTAVPAFLDQMKSSCQNYEKYYSSKEK